MGFFNGFEDDFFNDMALGFGKPLKVVFNTPHIKDMLPSYWVKADNGYRCTAKTLGVDKVNVTVEDYGIKVYGSTEVEGQTYDTTLELPITDEILDSITAINTKTINGLTFIDLVVDKPKKRNIMINGK